MGPHCRRYLELAYRYRLHDRHKDIRRKCELMEQGLIPDKCAEALIPSLKPRIDEQERRPNYLHRAPDDSDDLYPNGEPDIRIGNLVENEEIPIGLSLSGPFFCIFAGRAGSGKTTGIRRLIHCVAEYNRLHPETPVSLIILDAKGHDYGDIPEILGSQCLHFDVHGTLRLGLNAPEGVPANLWINKIVICFCSRMGLRFAWVTLANMIRWSLMVLNPTPAERLLWPDFQMLLDLSYSWIGEEFAAKAEYRRSLIQALEGITQASGDLFRTFHGIDFMRDVVNQGKSAVISMPNLSPPGLSEFVTDLILYQLLLGRMQAGHRVDRTDVIIVRDEGDATIARTAEEAFLPGMLPYAELARHCREFGIGCVFGLSKLGTASREVLNSVNHHFVYCLGDAESVKEARSTLFLPPHSEQILPALEPGEHLLRLPGPWSHAMLGRNDYVPPNRTVPTRFDSHDSVPSKRLSEMPEVLEALSRLVDQHNAAKLRQAKKDHLKLPDAAQKLLELISEHPWPLATLWNLMGTDASAETRKAAVQKLAKLGLCRFEDIRVGKKMQRWGEALPDGLKLLGKQPPRIKGRGGIVHRAFAFHMAESLRRKGLKVETEWVVPGKSTSHPADVAWQADGRWQVAEIVVHCLSNVISHLQACLIDSDVVASVTLVAPQQKVLAELKALIETEESLEAYQDRILYQTIDAYME